MASGSAIKLSRCSVMNHTTFAESIVKKSYSFGQLSLPKRNELSPPRHSLVASPGSYVPALTAIAAGVGNSTKANYTPSLPNFWRQTQGCNDWEGLLDPLHPLLRQEIIRYGEFATASYKAFELDPNSNRYLNCKYGKKNMLREIGMENCGYQVTKYIYATPDINIPIQNSSSCGRWIGFVAVSFDEAVRGLGRRDIVITFRGTVTNHEWMANFMSSLTSAMLDPHNPRPDVKVESGFLSLYTSSESTTKFGLESCREQLLSEVWRLLNKYKGENNVSITMTGHSMGSALALLLAYDITELGLNKKNRKPDIPVTVFSFGGPRVGNSGFKNRCEELGVKVLRIVNSNDPITKLPGVFLNENFRVLGGRFEFPWSCLCYAHVGVELILNFFDVQNLSCVHDLESYINLIKYPKSEDINLPQVQNQKEGYNLMQKAREVFLTTPNINILLAVLAGANLYALQLGSISMDIISSCGDDLLFGLLILFM